MAQGGTDRFRCWNITMVLKRVTIELDDVPDSARRTSAPTSLIGKQEIVSDSQSTSTPEQQDDYHEPETSEKDQDNVWSHERIGHTPADLVIAFINQPEFVATALTALSFLLFVSKLHRPVDFWQPAIAAIILNGIWFGVKRIAHR